MMCCSEHTSPADRGVAYGQRRWEGLQMADVEDGALILAAVGATIRDHRLQAGLTQAELAQRSGIGRPHLNHIEGGRKSPTVVVLVHLARSLGVPPGDLLRSVSVSKATR